MSSSIRCSSTNTLASVSDPKIQLYAAIPSTTIVEVVGLSSCRFTNAFSDEHHGEFYVAPGQLSIHYSSIAWVISMDCFPSEDG